MDRGALVEIRSEVRGLLRLVKRPRLVASLARELCPVLAVSCIVGAVVGTFLLGGLCPITFMPSNRLRGGKEVSMVEPVSLAASAVALLVPYLQQAAGRVAEQATDAAVDVALPALKRLYEVVKAKLRPGTYGGNQLRGMEERPDSEGRQQALRTALVEELESDPSFAAELVHVVREAQEATGVRVSAVDAGVVAGRDARLRGRFVAGRDMNLGAIPSGQPGGPSDEHAT